MKEYLSNFVDFLKLPPYILAALSIASGLLLFLPDNIIGKMYMVSFRAQYGFIIGIVFIISISILLVLLVIKIWKSSAEKRNIKRLKKAQINILLKMDKNLVCMIKSFLNEQSHTKMMPMQDGRIIELSSYNVISPAGQSHMVDMHDPHIKYFLQPWVIERIKENAKLRKKYS